MRTTEQVHKHAEEVRKADDRAAELADEIINLEKVENPTAEQQARKAELLDAYQDATRGAVAVRGR